jgi:hypothetical protein
VAVVVAEVNITRTSTVEAAVVEEEEMEAAAPAAEANITGISTEEGEEGRHH